MRGDAQPSISNLGCCEFWVSGANDVYRYHRRSALGMLLGSRWELCIREALLWSLIQISLCSCWAWIGRKGWALAGRSVAVSATCRIKSF
jgi:hypothetical protein